MSDTRYVPNRPGVAALAMDPDMSAAMVEIGRAAQAYAQSISPHGATGRYASSFVTGPTVVVVGGEPRQGAMVMNVSPYAAGVEWRNGQHVLARAATYVDGRSRMVATDAGRFRRSEVSAKRLRASRNRRRRASQR